MAVMDPLKVIIDNYPEGQVEYMEAINNPEDPEAGTRQVPFTKELWIEKSDFMEVPMNKFHRLAPGKEVRLRYAYFVTCTSVEKDADGNVIAVHCTYDPATKGGNAPDGRKVKGTIHWVSAEKAVRCGITGIFLTDVPDLRELRCHHIFCTVSGTVIDYDDLTGRITLSEQRVEAEPQVIFAVVS